MAVKIHKHAFEEDLLGCDTDDLDLFLDKAGNVDLGIKDDPEKYRRVDCDELITSYSINYTVPYKLVKNLTPLQSSIGIIITGTLASDWYFRQMRVKATQQRNSVRSDITRGNCRLPLVLVYQRKTVCPPFEVLEIGSELNGLARLCANAETRINEAVKPRYVFTEVETNYDHRSDIGRRGAGVGDARILVVGLYFEDRKESLYEVGKKMNELRRQESNLIQEKMRLEGLLGIQK